VRYWCCDANVISNKYFSKLGYDCLQVSKEVDQTKFLIQLTCGVVPELWENLNAVQLEFDFSQSLGISKQSERPGMIIVMRYSYFGIWRVEENGG